MLTTWWLLTIGIITGLVTRAIVDGKAFGVVADALLGITGAFAADLVIRVLTRTPMSWTDSTLLTIWGAAALPLLAHFLTGRKPARRLNSSSSASGLFGKVPTRTDR